MLIDQETKQPITLLYITIINATKIEAKLISVFVLIMALYTTGMLVMMYSYWKKSLAWRFQYLSQDEKYMDSDVALHCIEVSKIP